MHDNQQFYHIFSDVKEHMEKIHGMGSFKFSEYIINDDSLCIIIDFSKCIYELVVENKEFTPYTYVKIEILSIVEKENPIYVWYDDNYESEMIISQIDESLEFASKY